MANRYWVTGGTGNWNSTTNWSTASGGASGASVPGSADAALLDASSGAGTVTLDISPTIQTLTCTGFTGTLAFGTNTISLNSTSTIFTGATTMTVTGTPLIICTNSSATSRTITTTAVTESNSISFRVIAGTGTFTVSSGAIRDIDFTDGVNPTGFGGSLNLLTVTIYGSLKASTGMTVTSATNTMTFAATSGTKTINTAGVTFDRPFTFNGVGGTFQLAAALTSGSSRTLTLTSGTLNLAGYTLTTGLFSSSNSNARTLAFGSGKIVLTAVNALIYNTATGTGLTMTGTKIVELTGVGAVGETRTLGGPLVTSGGTESNAANIYIKAGADSIAVGTANRTYGTLDFTGFSGNLSTNVAPQIYGNLVLSTGMTVTGGANAWIFAATTPKTITTNGVTINNPITFDGVGGTWSLQDALNIGTNTLTLTNGTLNSNGYTITSGLFSSTGNGTRSLSLSGGSISLTSTGTAWTTSGTGFSMGATDKISLGSASTQTLSGGSITLGTVSIENSNAKTITGDNTFYNIVNTVVPATVNFAAGSTNSFSNFNLNGISGSLVTLRSTVSGSTYSLVKI